MFNLNLLGLFTLALLTHNAAAAVTTTTIKTVPTSCTYTPLATHSPGLNCQVTGTLKTPYIVGYGDSSTNEGCAAECASLNNACPAFGFSSEDASCTFYGKLIVAMGFVANKTGDLLSNIQCYGKTCGVTATTYPDNFQLVASGSGTSADGKYVGIEDSANALPFTSNRALAQNWTLVDGIPLANNLTTKEMTIATYSNKNPVPVYLAPQGQDDQLTSCAADDVDVFTCVGYDTYFYDYPVNWALAKYGGNRWRLGMINTNSEDTMVPVTLTAVPAGA